MKKKILFISSILSFFSIIFIDQLTKYWAAKKFLLSSDIHYIHNYLSDSKQIFHLGKTNWLNFELGYVRNTGAAWGFLGNLPENFRPYFFYIFTALTIIFIFVILIKAKKNFTKFCLLLIISGAIGNYIDRLILNYVIDWIHFSWKTYIWQYDYPVFNIADCAVTIGVILLVLENLILESKKKKRKNF